MKIDENRFFDMLGIVSGEWVIAKSGHPHFPHCLITEKDGGSICHFTPWHNHKITADFVAASKKMFIFAVKEALEYEESASGRAIIEREMNPIFKAATGKKWEGIKAIAKECQI